MDTMNLEGERAFYYVDGIPTKGVWVDLSENTDEDEIKQALADAELIQTDEDRKYPVAYADTADYVRRYDAMNKHVFNSNQIEGDL